MREESEILLATVESTGTRATLVRIDPEDISVPVHSLAGSSSDTQCSVGKTGEAQVDKSTVEQAPQNIHIGVKLGAMEAILRLETALEKLKEDEDT